MLVRIDIDEALLAEAMKLSAQPSARATVEMALHDLIRHCRARAALNDLRGLGWEGDLEAMRDDPDDPKMP